MGFCSNVPQAAGRLGGDQYWRLRKGSRVYGRTSNQRFWVELVHPMENLQSIPIKNESLKEHKQIQASGIDFSNRLRGCSIQKRTHSRNLPALELLDRLQLPGVLDENDSILTSSFQGSEELCTTGSSFETDSDSSTFVLVVITEVSRMPRDASRLVWSNPTAIKTLMKKSWPCQNGWNHPRVKKWIEAQMERRNHQSHNFCENLGELKKNKPYLRGNSVRKRDLPRRSRSLPKSTWNLWTLESSQKG